MPETTPLTPTAPAAPEKPAKAPKPRGGAPAAEGSAPSSALASSNEPASTSAEGATEPMARPAAEDLPPVERAPDDREPDSERPARRSFEREDRSREPRDMDVPPFAVEALVKALEKQGYKLTKSEVAVVEETDDEDKPRIDDRDLPYLAAGLTDTQLQEVLSIRANTRDVAKWKAIGAVPGRHWIPTANAHCTVGGKPNQMLKPGVPVLITDLDPETTEDFLAKGVIHAPGQAPRNPHAKK